MRVEHEIEYDVERDMYTYRYRVNRVDVVGWLKIDCSVRNKYLLITSDIFIHSDSVDRHINLLNRFYRETTIQNVYEYLQRQYIRQQLQSTRGGDLIENDPVPI